MITDTNHVYAGTEQASTPDWQALYRSPEYVSAVCLRCGCCVGDLTQHEEFHAKLNQMWGAAGLPLETTIV
jgi:hypothetical protein